MPLTPLPADDLAAPDPKEATRPTYKYAKSLPKDHHWSTRSYDSDTASVAAKMFHCPMPNFTTPNHTRAKSTQLPFNLPTPTLRC